MQKTPFGETASIQEVERELRQMPPETPLVIRVVIDSGIEVEDGEDQDLGRIRLEREPVVHEYLVDIEDIGYDDQDRAYIVVGERSPS